MGLGKWAIGGLGVGLTALSGQLAIARAASSFPPSLPKQDAAAPMESVPAEFETFETFTLPNQFAVSIPAGWFATGTDTEGYAIITSYAPEAELMATDIKTEVTLADEPPDTYVDRELDTLIQSGYTIDRFGLTSIRGNDAFRVWIIETPGDFSYQVITFVGYDQGQTAKIVSHYSDDSRMTIDTILAIHRSFDLVPAATSPATPDS